MKRGDFTELAKFYKYRPSYSLSVLRMLASYIGAYRKNFRVADIGAGTGKLTEVLIKIGLSGFAVEPNEFMLSNGKNIYGDNSFEWRIGYAENTGLPDSSIDWVLMGSSFHWANFDDAMFEFKRILKPFSYFTAIWNPRTINKNLLEQKIEAKIKELAPNISRVSSGAKQYTKDLSERLSSTGMWDDLLFIEAPYSMTRSPDEYVEVWRSVNDVQAQMGVECFEKLIGFIESEVKSMDKIETFYDIRAWTVRLKG
jgi:ubiquinone/menaquinone biosynthesis C-methylase UbiE